MSSSTGNVLLVGSVPFDSVEEVLETCARTLGAHAFALPDGEIGDARVFLGLELADGVDEMIRRAETARKFLPDFGVAHYCGYGRETPDRVRELLTDIAAGADRLAG